jgi:hypothetical protein
MFSDTDACRPHFWFKEFVKVDTIIVTLNDLNLTFGLDTVYRINVDTHVVNMLTHHISSCVGEYSTYEGIIIGVPFVYNCQKDSY